MSECEYDEEVDCCGPVTKHDLSPASAPIMNTDKHPNNIHKHIALLWNSREDVG
jgi:hypothetical protein